MNELTAEGVSAGLREACRQIADPVVIPDLGTPSETQVTLRLREACALWVACARLQRLGPARAV